MNNILPHGANPYVHSYNSYIRAPKGKVRQMKVKIVKNQSFSKGDLVRVKTMPEDERFCIIGFKESPDAEQVAVLKALFNETYIIEKPISQLESLLIKGRL